MNKVFWLSVSFAFASANLASAHAAPSVAVSQPSKPVIAPMPPLYDVPESILYVIGKGDKYGYINKQGKVIIEPKYSQAGAFSEGLAFVAKEQNGKTKYGFISSDGKEIIPLQYDYATDFHEGLALVQMNGKYGYINKHGKMVIEPAFHNAGSFADGLAWVVTENEKGWLEYSYINHSGQKLISSPLFQSAEDFQHDVAKVELQNPILDTPAYIDRSGNVIWKQNIKDVAYSKQEDGPKFSKAFTLAQPSAELEKKLKVLEDQAVQLERANPEVKAVVNQFPAEFYLQQLGYSTEQLKTAKERAFARDITILLYEKPLAGAGAVPANKQDTIGTWKSRVFYLLDKSGKVQSLMLQTSFHLTRPHEEDESGTQTAEDKQLMDLQGKIYQFIYTAYGPEIKKWLTIPTDDNWTWGYDNGTLLLEQGDACGASTETYRFIPNINPPDSL